jgi:hypothetical protein
MRTRPDWRERVRDALTLGNECDCLERLVDCFYEAWQGTAAWVWMKPNFPKESAKPEDLVQDFVTTLLASSVDYVSRLKQLTGLEHVRNDLRRCLINHCWTIARKAKRGPLPPTGGNLGPEPPAPPIVPIEDIEEMTMSETQRRINAIRREFPASDPSVPPTMHLLLLLERRWLLEFVGRSYVDDNGDLRGGVVPAAKVERELSCWRPEEASQSITAQERTLQEVWDDLREMAKPPKFQILDFDVAPLLEMRPNSLTTRKLRAWRILQEKYGVAYPRFPTI